MQHPALVTEGLFIRKTNMNIPISIQYIIFPTNPATRAPCNPFSSIANFTASSDVLHPTGPPAFFGHPEHPLPADTLLRPEGVSPAVTPQPVARTSPRSTTQGTSWNSTFNPLTPTFSSRHLLILRCARDIFLHTTPKTAFTTQHQLNAHKFNMIISTRSSFGPLSERVVERISDLGINVDSSASRHLGTR